MAPKAGVEDAMADMAKQLKALTATIQSNNTRMDSLEMLIKGLSDENKSLKKELVDRDKEISGLKTLVNNMDQRHRSWSARIFNIKMAKEDEYDNYKVMDAVYRTALLPILQGALADKVICKIPTVEQLLETAHVLPGPADKPKPVIVRFFNRNVRAIVFRGKKDYAPRLAADRQATRNNQSRPGKYAFPIYEDLSPVTYAKMRELATSGKTTACWTTNRHIRFKLPDDETVYRVSSVFFFVADIISGKKSGE